jgi:protein-S-isoprenylcysteine O-methyltransferase Ste14
VLLSKAGVMSMEAAWAFVMVISSAVIFLGLFLMSKGWSSIHSSNGELVTDGIYRYVRHPQCTITSEIFEFNQQQLIEHFNT